MNETRSSTEYPGGPADQVLLETFRTSPEAASGKRAISELLGRYQERVYIWCYRYVRDHERALDMAQEVLLGAYRNLASFAGHSRFSSWLFVIARNRCLSELRRPALLYDAEADPELLAAPHGNPDQILAGKLAEDEILELIASHLEPQEQEALWLRCFERMPVDTITRVLDIREASGARAVLQRARRKLRSVLRKQAENDEGSES